MCSKILAESSLSVLLLQSMMLTGIGFIFEVKPNTENAILCAWHFCHRAVDKCEVELYSMQVVLNVRDLDVIYTSVSEVIGLGLYCMANKMAA